MIKSTLNIADVKKRIFGLKEKPVEVTLNLGRNKIVRFCGRLEGVYPSLFTVKPFDGFNGKTSYSYQEYMCGRVKLAEIEKRA